MTKTYSMIFMVASLYKGSIITYMVNSESFREIAAAHSAHNAMMASNEVSAAQIQQDSLENASARFHRAASEGPTTVFSRR